MQHRTITTTAALAAAAALVPAVATARDDADRFPGDAPAAITLFQADGTVTSGTTEAGHGAFVRRLAGDRASGSYAEDTRGYQHATVIRTGFARPTTALAPLRRVGRRAVALRAITRRWTPEQDGSYLLETAFAREIATGRVLRIGVDAAKRLSADPRGGKAGLAYFYSAEGDMPAPGYGG